MGLKQSSVGSLNTDDLHNSGESLNYIYGHSSVPDLVGEDFSNTHAYPEKTEATVAPKSPVREAITRIETRGMHDSMTSLGSQDSPRRVVPRRRLSPDLHGSMTSMGSHDRPTHRIREPREL